ncbi:MAG: hypothetical protein ACJ74Q_26335, partial [Pyrinomonadaceae bacterium]
MSEQLPQVIALGQQLDDAAHQTQLGARATPGAHAAQQRCTVAALQQRTAHPRQHQQRESHQQEHPRPRLDAR